jgi:putative tricarboxylic transport membrane protein
MKPGDGWAGGFVALVGLIAIYAAWPLDFWLEYGPGPGFFPLVLGSGLVLMGGAVAVSAWTRREGAARYDGDLRKPLLVAGALASYLAVLDFLGFAIATVLFLFTLIHWVESRKAWLALTLAVSITLGLHLVFDTLLKTALPLGILKWIS